MKVVAALLTRIFRCVYLFLKFSVNVLVEANEVRSSSINLIVPGSMTSVASAKPYIYAIGSIVCYVYYVVIIIPLCFFCLL